MDVCVSCKGALKNVCVSHLKLSRNRDYCEFEENADTDLLNLEIKGKKISKS